MKYHAINCLLHILEGNNHQLFEILLSNQETFHALKKEIHTMNMELDLIENISEVDLGLVKGKTDPKVISSLLHIDVEVKLEEYRKQLEQKVFYIALGIDTDQESTFSMNEEILDGHLFHNPCQILEKAIFYIDKWPLLIQIDHGKTNYYDIQTLEDIEKVKLGKMDRMIEEDSFYYQISDIHLGPKSHNQGAEALLEMIHKQYPLLPDRKHHFILTGDLMNSPNKRNMLLAKKLIHDLQKTYFTDVTYIFGNHDMITMGLNLLGRQKTKVIAYLADSYIRLLEEDKIMLIKMNSCIEGNLARGKVGKEQMDLIQEEIEAIPDYQKYTKILLVHHHLYVAKKRSFIKENWNEGNWIGSLLDISKALIDANELKKWCLDNQIHYVLHGHKHIPSFVEENGIVAIGCGSSSGAMRENNQFSFLERDRKILRYLSYNLIRYSVKEGRCKNCLVYYNSKDLYQKVIEVHIIHH